MKYLKIQIDNTFENKSYLYKKGIIHISKNKVSGKRGISYKPRFSGNFDLKKRRFEKFTLYVTPQTFQMLKNDIEFFTKIS